MGYTDKDTDAFAIAEGAIVLTYVPAEDPDTPAKKTLTFTWGDITLDGKVNAADALAALYHFGNNPGTYPINPTADQDTYTTGWQYGDFIWGDITLDGKVNAADALAALYHFGNNPGTYPINPAEGQTTYTTGGKDGKQDTIIVEPVIEP